MNLTAEDLASGVLRDRVKVGASLADVDPMNLDSSVSESANKYQENCSKHASFIVSMKNINSILVIIIIL